MNDFKTTKIIPENEAIAEELRVTRKEQNISLKDASEKLKINIKYLEILETGQFNKLPSAVYGKNFLREYASFLGINPEAMVETYMSEIEGQRTEEKNNLFSKKIPRAIYFLTAPKIIKNFLIFLAVAVILSYLGFYINNITSPPALNIIEPKNDIATIENSVKIIGKSDPEAKIIINDTSVLMNPEGVFEKEVSLKKGINTITITAEKKYSKKNIITRKIIVREKK